ncbi:MAG: phage integrase SAM-like domain-containing protein [Bacteroides sp.]
MKYPTLKVVFDRKKLATKEKKGLIQIEVSHDGKRKWIGTGIKVYSDQWKDKCMVCMRADAMELNEQINITVNNIREWINALYKNGDVFSFEKLEKMLSQIDNPDSFLAFVEERISNRKIEESTKKQHYVMLKVLSDFGIIQNFSDLTLKNIKLWDDFIKSRVNEQSSVYGYHKRLKVYVNEAMQLDLIKKNPYTGFSIPRGESVSRKYLEASELLKIVNSK